MSRPCPSRVPCRRGSAGAQNATRQVGVLHARHTARTNTNTSAATMIQAENISPVFARPRRSSLQRPE